MSLPGIILELDGMSLEEALRLAERTREFVYALKIHDLLDAHGPEVVPKLKEAGAPRVFLDVKLYGTVETIRLRAKALKDSGADILSVLASGGLAMMKAAVALGPTEIFAATLSTSLEREDVELQTGHTRNTAILALARQAQFAGLHGIICTAEEARVLNRHPETCGLKRVITGVRSPAFAEDDKRPDTPSNAMLSGASYIVMGAQVIRAENPAAAIGKVRAEIERAF